MAWHWANLKSIKAPHFIKYFLNFSVGPPGSGGMEIPKQREGGELGAGGVSGDREGGHSHSPPYHGHESAQADKQKKGKTGLNIN